MPASESQTRHRAGGKGEVFQVIDSTSLSCSSALAVHLALVVLRECETHMDDPLSPDDEATRLELVRTCQRIALIYQGSLQDD